MNKSGVNLQFSMPFTPVVKWLMIINTAIWFVFQVILEGYFRLPFSNIFQLTPAHVIFDFKIWELATYMFLHSVDGVTHLLFNMLMLFMFGPELEQRWGKKFFLTYYMVCGIGAALIYCFGIGMYSAISGSRGELIIPVVGASGALFGLLLAYGWVFSERVIYLFMLVPLKAKHFVMLMGFLQIASMLASSRRGAEVAYLAHIGGILVGFVFLWGHRKYQQYLWSQKAKKKTGNLRLVVDNERKNDDSKGPKYWN